MVGQKTGRSAPHEKHQSPSSKIDLIGYSEGAWAITGWLYGPLVGWISAHKPSYVLEYGDPCWDLLGSRGIARLKYGGDYCSSDVTDYPSVAANEKAAVPTTSWCLYKDPICGYGWDNDLAYRVTQILGCAFGCPHKNYDSKTPGKTTAVVTAASNSLIAYGF